MTVSTEHRRIHLDDLSASVGESLGRLGEGPEEAQKVTNMQSRRILNAEARTRKNKCCQAGIMLSKNPGMSSRFHMARV